MTVLVTGGTGFVAGWTIAQLLERGHTVRTTVRDLARESQLRVTFPDAGDRLEVVAADLESDAGWAAAVTGTEAVLHIASPMGDGRAPKDPDELLRPARDGALRVLRAAVDAGVPRVVMTSSGAAATPPPGTEGVFDETLWTNPDQPGLDAYRRSKALAERAAWDFMNEHGGNTSFATVLPLGIFGPLLPGQTGVSVEVIGRMLRGMPGVPRIGINVVDVRDVADLHLRAMESPDAAGQRFIATSGFMWMREMSALLRDQLGDAGRKAPTRELPDFAVRLMARLQPGLGALVPMLGRHYTYTTAKSREVLGWSPRAAEETVLDTGRSLVARRLT